eukprot:a579_278.p1 GENE.a579_278~~a579_278.p1  ORF type:complete len:415 (+),score=143.67 a579_278:72-1247(+)
MAARTLASQGARRTSRGRSTASMFGASVLGLGGLLGLGAVAEMGDNPDQYKISGNGEVSSAMHGRIQLFTGNAHPKLASDVAALLGIPVSKSTVQNFRNGETMVLINESVRDRDCFVIQPTCNPNPNTYLMELVIMMDAMRRGGAHRVTAVLPLFGYARQDKKDKSRAPITAKVVADMIHNAGADRIIAIDLHAAQIQGFVNFPLDNLYASPLIVKYVKDHILKDGASDDIVIVSPDAGGAKRADSIATDLNSGLAIFSKKRVKAGEIESMILVGEVKGKTCIVVDDMCDSGGSLQLAAQMLMEQGAKEVYAAVVHGVFSDPALERIESSCLKELLVTDTIPMEGNLARCPKLRVISVAPLLAKAIVNVHEGYSLSRLFYAEAVNDLPGTK